MSPFYGWGSTTSRLEPLLGSSQLHSWNIHLSISKLTGKAEYAKHVVRNITSSKAAGQDNNITGQTASAQVLFYLNVHLFATILNIQGLWEVGDRGYIPSSPHQYETEICTRDIPCAMMTINNATDYDCCVNYRPETDFLICHQKWE